MAAIQALIQRSWWQKAGQGFPGMATLGGKVVRRRLVREPQHTVVAMAEILSEIRPEAEVVVLAIFLLVEMAAPPEEDLVAVERTQPIRARLADREERNCRFQLEVMAAIPVVVVVVHIRAIRRTHNYPVVTVAQVKSS